MFSAPSSEPIAKTITGTNRYDDEGDSNTDRLDRRDVRGVMCLGMMCVPVN